MKTFSLPTQSISTDATVNIYVCAEALNEGKTCSDASCSGVGATIFCSGLTGLDNPNLTQTTNTLNGINNSANLPLLPAPPSALVITFNSNTSLGGQGNMAPEYVQPKTTPTLTSNIFTNSGTDPYMAFAGWATSPDSTDIVYHDGDTLPSAPTQSMTLYAVWTEGRPVNFVGPSQTITQVIAKNSSAPLWLNQFSQSKSIFAGWSITLGDTTIAYANGGSSPAMSAPLNLYPVWQVLTVNYDFTKQSFDNQIGNFDNGTNYNNNVTFSGSTTTPYCANFDGSNTYVSMPNSLIVNNNYNFTVSMKFQTTQKGGVLLGYQNTAVGATPSSWVPLLFVDLGGHLLANLCSNGKNECPTTLPDRTNLPQSSYVADGRWHTIQMTVVQLPEWDSLTQSIASILPSHLNPVAQLPESNSVQVLSPNLATTLSFTIDGVSMGTAHTTGSLTDGMIRNQIGVGYVGGDWEHSDTYNYFQGCIQNYSMYAIPDLISFDPNNETGTMAYQSVPQGASPSLNANTFVNPGYTFAGWATESGGSVVYFDKDTIVPTDNMTLYAVWDQDFVSYDFTKESTSYTMTNLTSFGSVFDGVLNGSLGSEPGESIADDIVFDGSTNYVSMPSSLVFDNNDNFIVSMTFTASPDDEDNIGGVLLNYQSFALGTDPATQPGSRWLPILYIDNSGILKATMWYDGHGDTTIATNASVVDGKPHTVKLVVSRDTDSSMALYLDGAFVGKATPGFVFSKAGFTLNQIGTGWGVTERNQTAGWDYFKGTIANFKFSGAPIPNNSHKVIYNANAEDATGAIAQQWVANNGSVTLNKNTFTRPGYVFAGWATTSGGTAVYEDTHSFTPSNNDLTLYAVWQPVIGIFFKFPGERLNANS
ncbi:MAG: InlB B-repeat-containing protein [Myxococcaceae bacterium]